MEGTKKGSVRSNADSLIVTLKSQLTHRHRQGFQHFRCLQPFRLALSFLMISDDGTAILRCTRIVIADVVPVPQPLDLRLCVELNVSRRRCSKLLSPLRMKLARSLCASSRGGLVWLGIPNLDL